MAYHNGMKFTTIDSDNDKLVGGNCAEDYLGAWWYKACHSVNLNAKYWPQDHTAYGNGIQWLSITTHNRVLKAVAMYISI